MATIVAVGVGFRLGEMMLNVDWSKLFRLFWRPSRFKLSWATRVTLFRILLIVPFVSCMLQINNPELRASTQILLRHIAIGLFVCMGVGDALDGFLARHYRQVTKLGAFLDPVADKLLIVSSCLLLVSQRGHVEGFFLPSTVVVVVIGKDVFLVIGFAIVYFVTGQIYVAPTVLGKATTVLQLIMVGCILVAPEVSGVLARYPSWLSVIEWSAAGAAILATLVYIRAGSRYIERFERTHAKEAGISSD
jgi:cardiolipin synthase (CMP-forming)